jgi:hypothetical protein
MAVILTVTSRNYGAFRGDCGEYFCILQTFKLLHRHFELPDDAKSVWITLHTCPTINRLAVCVVQKYGYPNIKIPGRADMVSHTSWDNLLEPYIGKRLWLQVEYEE